MDHWPVTSNVCMHSTVTRCCPPLVAGLAFVALQACSPAVEELVGSAVSEATPCNPHTHLFRFYLRTSEGTRRIDVECNEALRNGISSGKKLVLVLERRDTAFEDHQYVVRSAKIDGLTVVGSAP